MQQVEELEVKASESLVRQVGELETQQEEKNWPWRRWQDQVVHNLQCLVGKAFLKTRHRRMKLQ